MCRLTRDWTGGQICLKGCDVSKAPKAQDAGKAENLAFEEALKRLEAIVEAMETEELPLEMLLARYEEGVRMAKACKTKLAEAELKIEKLEKNSAGEPVLRPIPADLAEES
jgi:exodeoxyribonuclease VII small subunit